jgi:hypothetical protein
VFEHKFRIILNRPAGQCPLRAPPSLAAARNARSLRAIVARSWPARSLRGKATSPPAAARATGHVPAARRRFLRLRRWRQARRRRRLKTTRRLAGATSLPPLHAARGCQLARSSPRAMVLPLRGCEPAVLMSGVWPGDVVAAFSVIDAVSAGTVETAATAPTATLPRPSRLRVTHSAPRRGS